jgi:YD repeat-containing protein
MTSVKDWLGKTTSFTYDSAGNLSTITYPNSTVSTYSYNPSEQLDKIAVTKSGIAQFSFDASGSNGWLNPDGSVASFKTTQISGYNLTPGSSSSPGVDNYDYGPGSRLTADTESGSGAASSGNTYNDNGEVSTQSGGLDPGTYTYSTSGVDAGQLKSISAGTSATFGYDDDGNRISGPDDTNTFGFDDQMLVFSDSLDSVYYTYDGTGLLQKSEDYEECCAAQQSSKWAWPKVVELWRLPRGNFP